MSIRHRRTAAIVGTAVLATVSAGLSAATYSPWSLVGRAESLPGSAPDVNTAKSDGCPILDPYTNDLFIARPSDNGDLDIWRAKWNGQSWASPKQLGPSINTSGNEFCPTPARGNQLFFVRGSAGFLAPGVPNPGDIYVAKAVQTDREGLSYGNVQRLPDPINSSAQEWSPSYYEEPDGTPVLYFSSTRLGSQDIFYSRNWGAPQLAEGLNPTPTTSANDARPNVRHDGLEIVFDSNRGNPAGAPDIWTSTRASTSDPWGAPTPITQVNSPAGESRASLSWDGTVLVFGSNRDTSPPGPAADIFVATRKRNGQ